MSNKIATREAYGKALAELAKENENVVVLDADLSKSTKTADFKAVSPERFFNMGIAEANMMGVAAGLSTCGKIPFVSTFAMFAAGRAFEQIRNSICYPKLNVKVCATHAGLTVGEDGASHQTVEDLSLMRSIPNMVVISPADAVETKAAIKTIANYEGPCYVRLGRAAVNVINDENTYEFKLGKGVVLSEGKDVTIIILSAYDYTEIEEAARDAGVDGFIAKPLFRSRLAAKLRELISDEPGRKDQNQLQDISKCDYSGKKVLLVEDNELNSEIAKEIISMTGAQVETAENGKMAVDHMLSRPAGYYDMIFMDIQMPVMNGYEATKAIRSIDDGRGCNIPIIAMTANAFAEDIIKAKKAGMNEHMAKPIDINKLYEVLRHWLVND